MPRVFCKQRRFGWRSHTAAMQVVAVGLALMLVTSKSRADLLQPGARSGSATAAGYGHNTGPGPAATITQTNTVPGTGLGNVASSVYVNPFFTGSGTPPSVPGEQIGTDAATVNLNSVSGSSYALNASASFGYKPGSNSDAVILNPAYSFNQMIIVTQPVQYTLTMSVSRPLQQSPGDYNALLPIPSESFSGTGLSLQLTAPYYSNVQSPPNSGNFLPAPLTVSQTFTGILQPGTYAFDSSWTAPQIYYSDNYQLNDSQSVNVSAALSVSSVPEPVSLSFVVLSAGILVRFKRNGV